MAESEPRTVLVLDADILIRHPLAEYLRGCGYRVIEAANSDEARQVLGSPETQVDVLFASVSGKASESVFALAAYVRSALPGIKIELAGAVQSAAQRAGDLCDSAPLRKPYDHQVVHDRIRRLLAARERAES